MADLVPAVSSWGTTWSLSGHEGATPESWQEFGRGLAARRDQLNAGASHQMWEVGDWLRSGEEQVFTGLKRSKVRTLAAELTGYSQHTLTMALSVARKVDPSTRIDGLSWAHHLLVAHLRRDQQAEWLVRAAEDAWSVAKLRAELKSAQVVQGRKAARVLDSRAARLVGELVKLGPDEISEPTLVQLREWLEQMATSMSLPLRQ